MRVRRVRHRSRSGLLELSAEAAAATHAAAGSGVAVVGRWPAAPRQLDAVCDAGCRRSSPTTGWTGRAAPVPRDTTGPRRIFRALRALGADRCGSRTWIRAPTYTVQGDPHRSPAPSTPPTGLPSEAQPARLGTRRRAALANLPLAPVTGDATKLDGVVGGPRCPARRATVVQWKSGAQSWSASERRHAARRWARLGLLAHDRRPRRGHRPMTVRVTCALRRRASATVDGVLRGSARDDRVGRRSGAGRSRRWRGSADGARRDAGPRCRTPTGYRGAVEDRPASDYGTRADRGNSDRHALPDRRASRRPPPTRSASTSVKWRGPPASSGRPERGGERHDPSRR